MMTMENGSGIGREERSDRLFHAEELDVPARVEIHKSHGEMVGFIFHAGAFSLPILRARFHQRFCARVERHPLRPWVMGRVTYKKKVLLENPGRPGIALGKIPSVPSDAVEEGVLSAVVWIDGKRMDFDALSPGKKQGYAYREIEVNTAPVLEQTFGTDALKVTTEIALAADGPAQRMTVEAVGDDPVELTCGFTSMFPRGVTEVHALDDNGELWRGELEHPSAGCGAAELFIPRARWLAAYDPNTQFGTSIYSPEFGREEMGHLLVMDGRQDFKVYHMAGGRESFPERRGGLRSVRLRVLPGHPQQLALFPRPIEATLGEWRANCVNTGSWVF